MSRGRSGCSSVVMTQRSPGIEIDKRTLSPISSGLPTQSFSAKPETSHCDDRCDVYGHAWWQAWRCNVGTACRRASNTTCEHACGHRAFSRTPSSMFGHTCGHACRHSSHVMHASMLASGRTNMERADKKIIWLEHSYATSTNLKEINSFDAQPASDGV